MELHAPDYIILLIDDLERSLTFYPYSDTSRTYAPNPRIYGYIKVRLPSSLATAKP